MARYDPQKHHRRSVRLRGYDYRRPGAYFVTLCVHDRACVFGEIVDGVLRRSPVGELAHACWVALPDHHPNVRLDAFVVMPNHVHGIVVLIDPHDGSRIDVSAGIHRRDTIYRVPTPPAAPPPIHPGDPAAPPPIHPGDPAAPGSIESNQGDTRYPAPSPAKRPGLLGLGPSPEATGQETFGQPAAGSLSTVMRTYKAAVTRRCGQAGHPFRWQPRFYEHIVRNQADLQRIRRYIAANPKRWQVDRFHLVSR